VLHSLRISIRWEITYWIHNYEYCVIENYLIGDNTSGYKLWSIKKLHVTPVKS